MNHPVYPPERHALQAATFGCLLLPSATLTDLVRSGSGSVRGAELCAEAHDPPGASGAEAHQLRPLRHAVRPLADILVHGRLSHTLSARTVSEWCFRLHGKLLTRVANCFQD